MAPRKAFPLRLEPEVYDALERWAADELRSVNGQIQFVLREAVMRAGRLRAERPARRPGSAESAGR
ncbi:MAG TPA: DNA-binding protein [Gemmatimonadales bacterium]